MRVLISGGGTGGHVYPALAVVDQLLGLAAPAKSQPNGRPSEPAAAQATEPAAAPAQNLPGSRPESPTAPASAAAAVDPPTLLWVGSRDGLEEGLVRRAGLAYQGIDTGQLRGINPLTALVNAGKMVRGLGQALGILGKFRPDVCFVTGGYVCAPVAAACRLRGIPLLIYLPDMVPGLAIKRLSRLADIVAVSFPDAAHYFPGKAVVTGYPVRAELVAAAQDRRAARQQLAAALDLDLSDGAPLLLVWGGSRGARSINKAIEANRETLLAEAHILHVTGTLDYQRVNDEMANLPASWQARYHPVAYLHEEMTLALAGADVTVCRAGASTLGELPVARLSSILVPYPYSGAHQWPNARQLADHGAAQAIADEDLSADLAPALVELLHDPAQRSKMENALAALAQPHAAAKIAQELMALAAK